jgi:hypothetical protein
MVDTTNTTCSIESSRPVPAAAGAPEIEVTPEMVKAGMDALNESCASETYFMESSGYAFRKVFIAMMKARPSASKGR